MKSMPDDCSTTLSSVLHQNGSPHDKCAGSGVIIIFSKTERKDLFCFCFCFCKNLQVIVRSR